MVLPEARGDAPLHALASTTLDAAAAALVDELVPPFALFGHCSSAIVAFQLARALRDRGLPPPKRLIVAGQQSPRLADTSDASGLPLEARLRLLGGTNPAVLENRELLELLRPMLEADFRLLDEYVHTRELALDIPITVVTATADAQDDEQFREWQCETTQRLDLRWIDADHFFSGESWLRLGATVAAATRK